MAKTFVKLVQILQMPHHAGPKFYPDFQVEEESP
jgi:hypothetical protein